MTKKTVPDQTIIKSNEMVAADWDEMTLKEMQLLLMAISLIPSIDNKSLDKPIRVTISKKEMDEVFGLNNMSNQDLKKLSDQLQTRKATIRRRSFDLISDPCAPDLFTEVESKDSNWESMVIVPTCKFVRSDFTLTLNQDLNPHFLELHDRVTRYQRSNLNRLSSVYHIPMYEMLVMAADSPEKSVTVHPNRLREIVGARSKYPKFTDFRRSVIDPGVDAINETTDLDVTYNLVRKGGPGVRAIVFNVTRKATRINAIPSMEHLSPIMDCSAPDESAMTSPGSISDELLATLVQSGMTSRKASDLVNEYLTKHPDVDPLDLKQRAESSIQAARRWMQKLVEQKRPVRINGIMRSAILNEWEPDEDHQAPIMDIKPPYPASTAQMSTKNADDAEITYSRIIERIESDNEYRKDFERFINSPHHVVAADLYRRLGLRGAAIKQEIMLFGAIQSGAIRTSGRSSTR